MMSLTNGEIILSGKWKMLEDPNNEGEKEQWYLPKSFPKVFKQLQVPVFPFSVPFEHVTIAWVKKEFILEPQNKKNYYLVVYWTDQAKVWVN